MCSVNDYDCGVENTPIISKTTNLDVSKCKKCEENGTVIVLRGKDAYCKNCFLASSTHKFRATLGKSKIIRPNDNILVAHSGSAASSVLLHLIHAGMHESAHKRLIFKSTVLYIDEGILEDKSQDQRRTIEEKISNQLKNFAFTGFKTKINESLSESELKIFPIDSLGEKNFDEEEENEKGIKNTFATLSEQSAKNDLLVKLRTRLLIRAARHLNCNKIFTAETATSLSISILNNITMGRGAHLSLDVGFADTRFSDIMILRPMRAFTNMEIDYYHRFQNVEIPVEFRKKTNLKSIQTLIDEFVNEMDKESHSTVSTVLRTGEKLCTMISKEKYEKHCILCNAPLDTIINGEICAIQAINYSQLVSTSIIEPNSEKNIETLRNIESNDEKIVSNGENIESNNDKLTKSENFQSNKKIVSNCENSSFNNKIPTTGNSETIGENNCNCDGEKCCTEKNVEIDLTILKKNLCYGCRLIVVNFKDINDVPSFMINSARDSLSFQKMHDEIADFLL